MSFWSPVCYVDEEEDDTSLVILCGMFAQQQWITTLLTSIRTKPSQNWDRNNKYFMETNNAKYESLHRCCPDNMMQFRGSENLRRFYLKWREIRGSSLALWCNDWSDIEHVLFCRGTQISLEVWTRSEGFYHPPTTITLTIIVDIVYSLEQSNQSDENNWRWMKNRRLSRPGL